MYFFCNFLRVSLHLKIMAMSPNGRIFKVCPQMSKFVQKHTFRVLFYIKFLQEEVPWNSFLPKQRPGLCIK